MIDNASKRPLYQSIVLELDRYDRLMERLESEGASKEEVDNWNHYLEESDENIKHMDSLLPSGSGIDNGSSIDTGKSSNNKIVINSSFHFMDEHGYYDGWQDFKVVVKPSLMFSIDVSLTRQGELGNYQSWLLVRDYLWDVFDLCLRSEINLPF